LLRNRCKINAKTLRDLFGIDPQFICDHFAIAGNHCGIASQSLHDRSEISTQLIFNRCGIAEKSLRRLRDRCAFASRSLHNRSFAWLCSTNASQSQRNRFAICEKSTRKRCAISSESTCTLSAIASKLIAINAGKTVSQSLHNQFAITAQSI
jgi:hypothetical protein